MKTEYQPGDLIKTNAEYNKYCQQYGRILEEEEHSDFRVKVYSVQFFDGNYDVDFVDVTEMELLTEIEAMKVMLEN